MSMAEMDEPMNQFFHKGIAMSVFQNSGGWNSNWGAYERARGKFFGLLPNIMDGSKVGTSTNFWERYEYDIALAAKLGVNSFRFSFEWHRIEPNQGQIDKEAVKRYHSILDCLDKFGLIPNATLVHFTHPMWLEEMGGFENPKSIDLFVEYAKLMYTEFGHRITFWSTFNEPTCSSFGGWVIGAHPPGKLLSPGTQGKVLMHMLIAHTRAYHAIKGLPNGSKSRVGIVMHDMWFMSANSDAWYNGLVRFVTGWLTYLWGRPSIVAYFTNSKFEWRSPFGGKPLKHTEPGANESLDWFGLNYYTRAAVNFFFIPQSAKGDEMTDMGYHMYGPGMYESIAFWSVLERPIYITETGCADRKDAFRDKFIQSYFENCVKAIKDGYDVRGFYYWTLVDNFEWSLGYSKKFGLFTWGNAKGAPETERKMTRGARVLISLYQMFPPALQEFVAAAKVYAGLDPAAVEQVPDLSMNHPHSTSTEQQPLLSAAT